MELNRAKCYFESFDKDDEFIDDFERQLQFLDSFPEVFQVRYRNIRIIKLENFDYAIHYQIVDDKIIVVNFLSNNQDFSMQIQIAILRGINVGGHKKIIMADLKLLFEELGFAEVKTYVQSGNVVFSPPNPRRGKDALSTIIYEGIKNQFGFEVPVLVKNISELEEILAGCPFSEEKKVSSYFTLLNETPSKNLVKEIMDHTYPNEEFVISKNCVYFFSENGYGNAKCNNNFFEKKLKVSATTRNYRTLIKLIALAG